MQESRLNGSVNNRKLTLREIVENSNSNCWRFAGLVWRNILKQLKCFSLGLFNKWEFREKVIFCPLLALVFTTMLHVWSMEVLYPLGTVVLELSAGSSHNDCPGLLAEKYVSVCSATAFISAYNTSIYYGSQSRNSISIYLRQVSTRSWYEKHLFKTVTVVLCFFVLETLVLGITSQLVLNK